MPRWLYRLPARGTYTFAILGSTFIAACSPQATDDADEDADAALSDAYEAVLAQAAAQSEQDETDGASSAPLKEQDVLAQAVSGMDPAARLGFRLFNDNRLSDPGANLATSCRTCHIPPAASDPPRLYNDYHALSVLPANRAGAKEETRRNTPSLMDVSLREHFNLDGSYETLEEVVSRELTSRRMGWSAEEDEHARNEIYALVLNDMGEDVLAEGSYIEQFKAVKDIDVLSLSGEEVFDQVVGSLLDFLNTLQTHNTSGYDAVADMNRLNTALAGPGDTPQDLSGRIFGRIANEEGRVLIRFVANIDEQSYQGMKTFMRVEPTYSSSTMGVEENVGNCIACHVPPKFTDFKFHNTGVTQMAYDALHGEGSFMDLELGEPSDATMSPVNAADPASADLGRWNVEPSEENIAAFRTPMLRNIQMTDPYMHDGQYETLEAVIRQKMRAAEMAREGTLRNPDPELLKINLTEEDIPQLVAFLQVLREVPPGEYRDFRISNVHIRQDPKGEQTYENY